MEKMNRVKAPALLEVHSRTAPVASRAAPVARTMASLAAAAVPSRAGLLSSRYPRRRGVNNTHTVRSRAPAPRQARWGANSNSKVSAVAAVSAVVAGDVKLAAEEDGAVPLTAIIVGGGIAGFAAAVALRRVVGRFLFCSSCN